MDAKSSYLGNIIYTLLTSLIIVLGKLRDLTCVTSRTSALRFDRTLPGVRIMVKDYCLWAVATVV